LVRDKNLIKNDDDIDILINLKDRDKLIEILKKNSVIVDFNLSVNKEKCFSKSKELLTIEML
jgi:phosphorylcholine metabolism protein LicD